MESIRGILSSIFGLLIVIVAIFLFALLVDQITPLKQLDAYLKENPQPWTGMTLVGAFAGLSLLLFAWISWGLLTGQPMSEDEAKDYMHTSAGSPRLTRVFRGKATGFETPQGAASFREVKDAFRSGAWLRDPVMRVFCLGTVGLLLLALGGFGYFVVTAPPAAKLICAGALLYAFGRTTWGFWKA
jgi:hypothetical protein